MQAAAKWLARQVSWKIVKHNRNATSWTAHFIDEDIFSALASIP